MNPDADNTNTVATEKARDFCDQLEVMIDNEDWVGIRQVLQFHHERQHQHRREKITNSITDDSSDGSDIGDSHNTEAMMLILQTLTSNGLQFKLLQRKADEEAKSLLLLLFTLGGKDFAMTKDEYGRNSLQIACSCYHNTSIDVITKIIEVGGRDVILEQDEYGWNSLQYACAFEYSASIGIDIIDVISKLVEIGQRDVVVAQNYNGETSLHVVCAKGTSAEETLVDLLIHQGGTDLLLQGDNSGRTPLQFVITKHDDDEIHEGEEYDFTPQRDNASLLISKGLQLQVGGEYSIGGLFNNLHTNQESESWKLYYYNWKNVVRPALEQVVALPENHHLPILQALIMDNASLHIIKDAMNHFQASVNTMDCFGRYPIDIAVRQGLTWDDGMEIIVGNFASTNRISALYVCAKHGVSWENGMKTVLGRSGKKIVTRADVSTGLYPFMLAAVGVKYSHDLGSIYHLIKKRSQLVRQYEYGGN